MEKRLMYSNEQQQQVMIPSQEKTRSLFVSFPSCILIINYGQKMSLFYPWVRFYSRRLSLFLLW